MIDNISDNALELIMKFEVGGTRRYYEKYLAKPSWPGGASGVTIGIGYDLGYEKEFLDDWGDRLTKNQLNRLTRTLGLTGIRAKSSLSGVRDIVISWEDAVDVFKTKTLPVYISQTLEAFPNSELLPPDAFGALVSLVFNRGPLIDNSDRRKEMKEIKRILSLGDDEIIDNDDIKAIAQQVRSMARLWKDDLDSDGDLHDRRLAEAELIENSIG